MPLEYEQPPVEPKANVLLYGPPKTFKSMGAASAPGPILYLNLDQPNAVTHVAAHYGDKIKFAKWKGLDTLTDVRVELEKPDHGFETVVLDTVGDLYRRLVQERSNDALRPQIGYYGDAGVLIERWCRRMCANQSVNFVAVAHEQPIKDEEAGRFERLPFTGSASNPTLGNKLAAMVDVIGYTGATQEEGDAEPRFLAQLVPANGRRGGQRWNVLGKVEELNLTDWVDRIARHNAPKQAQKKEAAKA